MNKLMNYRDFAQAYGTCFLVAVAVSAILWPRPLNLRMLGVTLFPIVAFVYAVTRPHAPETERSEA